MAIVNTIFDATLIRHKCAKREEPKDEKNLEYQGFSQFSPCRFEDHS